MRLWWNGTAVLSSALSPQVLRRSSDQSGAAQSAGRRESTYHTSSIISSHRLLHVSSSAMAAPTMPHNSSGLQSEEIGQDFLNTSMTNSHAHLGFATRCPGPSWLYGTRRIMHASTSLLTRRISGRLDGAH